MNQVSENGTPIWKSPLLWAAVAALLIAVLYLSAANPHFRFMEGASAIKILHARALLAGQGYTDIGRVGAPPEIVRPPGFPAFMALVFAVFGENLLVLKIINNLFAPAGFLALFLLLKRRSDSPFTALAIAFAGYLFPFLVGMARYLEAELMFCFLFFAALYVFERAHDEGHVRKSLAAIFTFLLCISSLVRSVAFVLVFAALPALGFRKEVSLGRRLVFALVIVVLWAVVGGGWMLRNQAVAPKGEMTYADKLLADEPVDSVYWLLEDQRTPLLWSPGRASALEIIARSKPNSVFYLGKLIGSVRQTWTRAGPAVIVALLAVLIMTAGFINALLKKRRITELAVLLYLVVILLWPYQDNRFIVPVFPLLLYYLSEGIGLIAGLIVPSTRDHKKAAVIVSAAVMSILAAVFAYHDLRLLIKDKDAAKRVVIKKSEHFQITATSESTANSALLLQWLKQNAAKEDVIMFHSYAPCALITGRQCTGIPLGRPEKVLGYIKQKGVDWILLDDEFSHGHEYMAAYTEKVLRPACKAFPEYFREAKTLQGSGARVLKVRDKMNDS